MKKCQIVVTIRAVCVYNDQIELARSFYERVVSLKIR